MLVHPILAWLTVGNDAHYTLAAFKHMVSNERKVVPVEHPGPIQFTLRDVEAADFEVKPPKEKPPPREKPPPEQVAPANVDLMTFGDDGDEEYNRLYEIEDPQKKSKRSKKKSQRPPSPTPSMTPSEHSVTEYDGTTSEAGSEVPLKDVTKALVDLSVQSALSDWKPVRFYHNDLMPLPTDTLVVIPKTNNKKKSNRKDTPAARIRRPTIETDLSKYGNLIDDLTDVFGQPHALSVDMTKLLI